MLSLMNVCVISAQLRQSFKTIALATLTWTHTQYLLIIPFSYPSLSRYLSVSLTRNHQLPANRPRLVTGTVPTTTIMGKKTDNSHTSRTLMLTYVSHLVAHRENVDNVRVQLLVLPWVLVSTLRQQRGRL